MNEYFLLRVINGIADISVVGLSDFVAQLSNGSSYYRLFKMTEDDAKNFINQASAHRIEEKARLLVKSKKIEHLAGYGALIRY